MIAETATGALGPGRDAVEAISTRGGEPGWLRDRRLRALDVFDRLPIPSRADEEYRRTDLRRLNLGSFAIVPPGEDRQSNGGKRGLPASVRSVLADASGKDSADGGAIVQQSQTIVHQALNDDLASQGVILCSLDEAVRSHPELVEKYLTDDRIGADEDKWSAMNSAFWTGGAFLYVPSGAEVALPLRAVFAGSGAGQAHMARTLIVVDDWAQATFIADYLSLDGGDGAAFNNSVVDVVAGEGSTVRYCHIQNWGPHVWNFERVRFFARRDSAIHLFQAAFGSRLTKSFVHAHLDETGANAELLGLVFIGGKQHVDFSTLQDHRAGHSMSDLLFKCAMLEDARSVYGGLIRIAPGAQRSDAYQNNRNMLLSERARADSIPMLEIEANDVRCTHGSTTSSVDEEELFYLQSRGLPHAEAERVIVGAFFSAVIDRVPLAGVKNRLTSEIENQIGKLRFD